MSPQPSPPSLQQLREILLMPGEMLPEHVVQQIVALGPDAIAPLQAILDDEDLHDEDGPAQGWAPIRAARLLGELRAASAIPRLLELAAGGPDFIITNEATHALERIGEAAIEPVLEAANRTEDDFYRGLLSEVLAASPRKDDRIFELLLRVLDDNPDVGIGSMAKYGDKRAIPVLLRLLEAYEPDPEVSLFADQTLIELKAALEELEAELTPSQSALLEQHYREMKRKRDLHRTLEAQAAARQGPVKREGAKVGRNDPCPCGSGKKFKKCCGR